MRERRELGRLLTSRVDCDLPVYVQFVHILLVTLAARFRGLILLLLAEREKLRRPLFSIQTGDQEESGYFKMAPGRPRILNVCSPLEGQCVCLNV